MMVQMITTKDLYDILENKIANEAQKSLFRSNFPPQIAEKMCNAMIGRNRRNINVNSTNYLISNKLLFILLKIATNCQKIFKK